MTSGSDHRRFGASTGAFHKNGPASTGDDRKVLNGIFFVLRDPGSPWRDLDADRRYGPYTTVL